MAGSPTSPPADDGFPIPPAHRPLAGMALILSNLMVVLDITIANVSVPHIAGNLGATLDQGTWVITSYAVAEAISVPLSGWLVERFGVVRLFYFSLGGFVLFSVLCGLSVSLPMLVVCRIGQGLCGGPIMPIAQSAIVRIFAPAQLPRAFAAWTLTVMMGPAIGPVIGGLISDYASWHWIFFINVPIGIICGLMGLFTLRPVETVARKVRIDRTGLGLLVVWIGALQLMLDLGRDHDWFADPLIVGLAVMAVVGLCAFVIWELTEAHPVVDIRLFRNWPFTTCVLATGLSYGAYFSGIVTVPQWLQATMGYSATAAGMITGLSAVGAMIASQVALRLMLRVDPRLLVTIGCLWSALSFLLRATWNTDADMFYLAVVFGIQGFGMPLLMMPLTNMAMSTVSMDQTASGAGLNNFARTMSVAISTALVLTHWNSTQVAARTELADHLNPAETVATLGQLGLTGPAASAYLGGLADRQAVTLAMLDSFMLAAVAMTIAGVAVWILPRIELTRLKGTKPPAEAH